MTTSKAAFLKRVRDVAREEALDLAGEGQAIAVTAAVFRALHDELTAEEGMVVAKDLPSPLEKLWQRPWENSWIGQVLARLRGPGRINREVFFERVQRNTGLPDSVMPGTAAPAAVKAVFTALRETLPAEDARRVASELPMPLRDIWEGRSGTTDLLISHEEGSPEGMVGEVPIGEWASFLAGLSAHYQLSPVRILVEEADGQTFEIVNHMPLIGMEPEIEPDGVRAIDVVVGETGGEHPQHLMHRAQHPNRILLQVNSQGYAHLLNIEQEDGGRTLVRFAA